MRCTRHSRRDCSDARCRNERDSRRTAAADDSFTNPLSPLHQAAYGGTFYGSGSGSSPSDCDTSSSSGSSSSSDSGTSSCGGGGE